jgi:hypothetical protein
MGRDVSCSHFDKTTDVGSEACPTCQLHFESDRIVYAYISPWSLADGTIDTSDCAHQAVHHAPNECSHNGIAEPCSDRSTELIQSEVRPNHEVVKHSLPTQNQNLKRVPCYLVSIVRTVMVKH